MSALLESSAAFHSSLIGFLHRQWTAPKPIPPGTDLTGQVAIITGANSGLGFEAGRQLLQLGLSHLIIAVRSQSKGERAADILRHEFPRATVSVWLVDMMSYDSITAFAKRCEALAEINMVILNAGLQASEFRLNDATGHEETLQVNYLSTALLTILLLPILKEKGRSAKGKRRPVLTVVSSDTSYWARIESSGPILPSFDRPEAFDSFVAYKSTKLMEILFVIKLAEAVNPDDVVINLANPGLTAGTEFFSKQSLLSRLASYAMKMVLARSVQNGASAYVDAAVVEGEESHGSFVSEWTLLPYPANVYTQEGALIKDRLWEETMEELNFAGVSRIIQELGH